MSSAPSSASAQPSGGPWNGILGLHALPSDAPPTSDLPSAPSAPLPPPPPPPPARVEGEPTERDRAYTYILQLPVTRVRQLCRDAKLKQFGRKDQSQPRLFWGAAAAVEAATEGTLAEKWAAVLPGLEAWIASPHRDQTTVWLAAPPPEARPANFHTFYAIQFSSKTTPTPGATAAAQAALSGQSTLLPRAAENGAGDGSIMVNQTSQRPAASKSEQVTADGSIVLQERVSRIDGGAQGSSGAAMSNAGASSASVANEQSPEDTGPTLLPVDETPTLRDKAYTYITSLPVTAVRQICKRLKLKQFGRKAESQARLYWFWEEFAGSASPPSPTQLDPSSGEQDPEVRASVPWRDALPGFEEWLSAEAQVPLKWVRAPPANTRPPGSPGKRRESLGGRRKRFCLNELARLVCTLISSPALRARFISVAALPPYREVEILKFWCTCVEPVFNDPEFVPDVTSSDADPTALPLVHRKGDELRRYFDDSKPLFVVTFGKWQDARASADQFDSLLCEGKLSALERRASIIFKGLKCGTDDQCSDVLAALLRNTGTVQHSVYQTGSDAVQIAPRMVAEPSDDAHVASPMFSGTVEAGATNEGEEPITKGAAEAGAAKGMAEGNGSSGSVLGKRPRVCCEQTAQMVEQLSKRLDEALVPVAKMQSQLLKMQKDKALVDVIQVRRTLQKDLEGKNDPTSVRLREANTAALAQLIAESEAGNNP